MLIINFNTLNGRGVFSISYNSLFLQFDVAISTDALPSVSNGSNGPNRRERPLPSAAQVVVCGGGVVGSSVAYHLPKYGFSDVVLLEQGR